MRVPVVVRTAQSYSRQSTDTGRVIKRHVFKYFTHRCSTSKQTVSHAVVSTHTLFDVHTTSTVCSQLCVWSFLFLLIDFCERFFCTLSHTTHPCRGSLGVLHPLLPPRRPFCPAPARVLPAQARPLACPHAESKSLRWLPPSCAPLPPSPRGTPRGSPWSPPPPPPTGAAPSRSGRRGTPPSCAAG